MQETVLQVPYRHNEKSCLLCAEYGVNTDPVTSGFEIVKNLIPDLNICIGYPTMRAFVKEHEGYGFCRYSGFIQVITIEHAGGNAKMIDVTPAMQEAGLPFFAYGYPPEIYDAPVNNYGLGKEIKWFAKTFLVDMPSYVNNNTISFLAGFQWGYIDSEKGTENIPIEIIERDSWTQETSFLKENCPKWNFA